MLAKTVIRPNANFYSLSGDSSPLKKPAEYEEYRRSWMDYPQKFVLRDFPMHLDIEASNRCNLKCVFCDKLHLLKGRKKGDMEYKLYRKIIDEGSGHRLWGVKLSYRGEPLLHKDLARMVRYAKKKGIIDVYFNTNAMLLDKDTSSRLIDAGLDRISVSIEGIDRSAFEKGRVGARFEQIRRNVEALISLRRALKVDHPRVRIQSIYFSGFKSNEYTRYWAAHCDEVAAVDYKDSMVREQGVVYDWACPQLWQRMTIEFDGTVLACNNDDYRLLSPGNVRDSSIRDCWHNNRVEDARQLHKKGRSHEVAACDGCPWRTAQIKKVQAAMRKEDQ